MEQGARARRKNMRVSATVQGQARAAARGPPCAAPGPASGAASTTERQSQQAISLQRHKTAAAPGCRGELAESGWCGPPRCAAKCRHAVPAQPKMLFLAVPAAAFLVVPAFCRAFSGDARRDRALQFGTQNHMHCTKHEHTLGPNRRVGCRSEDPQLGAFTRAAWHGPVCPTLSM